MRSPQPLWSEAVHLARAPLISFLTIILIAASFAFFAVSFTHNLSSDLEAHTTIARNAIRSGTYPGAFLYYLAVAAGAGFSQNLRSLHAAAAVLLALAVGSKFLVTVAFADVELRPGPSGATGSRVGSSVAVTSVLVLLAFSLPAGHMYLGQIPPNVWHNSTTIFVMPFAVMLYWVSLMYLRTSQTRWLWWSLVAGALNIAIKPSFVLAFLIVFPLAAVARFRFSPAFWRSLLLPLGLALLVGAQYLYIYVADPTSDAGSAGSGVAVSWLHVWPEFSRDIPLSLAASFVFPLAALAVHRGRLWSQDLVGYALALLFVSVLIFAGLTETGPREYDGNFSWGAIISAYVVFLATAVGSLRILDSRRPRVADLIVGAALLVQVAAGVRYLVVYLERGSFV